MDENMQGRKLQLLLLFVLEEEAEEVDENVRTYENAVVLYEDKKYYPDAEEVLLSFQIGCIGI